MINPDSSSTVRIKFIDGLRAIAVLMVMFFHFYYQQIADAGESNVDPIQLQRVFQFGNMGVYIFFVISGFIVSHVTYNRIHNVKYIVSFIVRRQVRLDPPFWLALTLGTALAVFSVEVFQNDVYVPTSTDVLFNFIYLFDIFDKYDIIRVGWTLCLEIQFYLMFVISVFLLNTYCKSTKIRIIFYLCLFIVSILSYGFFPIAVEDYIINYWFVFFLGVGVTLLIHNEINERVFVFCTYLTFSAY